MADKDAQEEQKQPKKYPKTGVDFNRAQLERLLKNPDKPVVLPEPPKEKTVRPPKDMVKNVQGSSAGAGSGEFHVYKASRRREYERIKLMEDEKAKVGSLTIFCCLSALKICTGGSRRGQWKAKARARRGGRGKDSQKPCETPKTERCGASKGQGKTKRRRIGAKGPSGRRRL